MKQFIYSFRYLRKSPANQIIKTASLTLGLAVGLLIFAKVAFEKSFDNFFPDSERVYQMKMLFSESDGNKTMSEESDMLFGPVAPILLQEVSQIESATRTAWLWRNEYFYNNEFYSLRTIMADTLFFDVLDYGMLQGDPKELKAWNHALISQSAARLLFNEEDPIGKTILYNKKTPLTIKGIFKDVPKNSQVDFDIILSLYGINKVMGWSAEADDWAGGDSYRTYVKLHPGAKISDVEAQLPGIWDKYGRTEIFEKWGISHLFRPIRTSYSDNPENKQLIFIISILALVVLFMSAMNYVLISISSLGKRTKTIAVQKCNGAKNRHIFGQFLTETALLILFSLMLSVLLLVIFKKDIQLLSGETLETLFAPGQLISMLWVVFGFFLLAGVVPGRIFSRIPVTQAFKEVKANTKWWKQLLLLIQFTGVTFVLIFLLILIRQYNLVATQDVGYQYDELVYLEAKDMTPAQYSRVKSELNTLPFIEGVAASTMPLTGGMSGMGIFDPETREIMFSSRHFKVEPGFLPMLGIDIKYGEHYKEDERNFPVLVNEKFADLMRWEGDPVGNEINYGSNSILLDGVVKDFQVGSMGSAPQQPVFIQPLRITDTAKLYTVYPHIRLSEMTPDNLEVLTGKLQELLPDQKAELILYSEDVRDRASAERMLRNTVTIASVIIFLIALTGLIGYVNDEVRRRRREIAIRRINGALVPDIIRLISRQILIMGGIAVGLGVAGAWIITEIFIRNFPVQVSVSVWSFIGGAFFVLAIIIVTIVIRSRKAALENPVNTIKTE